MNYRARLATNRRKEIETHRYFLLFQEYLDLLKKEKQREMNIAHIAFYANQVLQDLNIETLTVGFWSGLLEGRGNTRLVPDSLLPDEPDIDDSIEDAFIEIDPPFNPHE